ncbi:MAG: CoA-binding protein [Chitinophagaceae bacterium]
MSKKTVVLGASSNPSRYSYLAIDRLKNMHYPVVGIGKKAGTVGDVMIETEQKPIDDVDTVSLYLNANNQKSYYDYIFSLNPKRIIFNPGAENEELFKMAEEKGIKPVEACTLVMLATGQF